MSTVSLMNMATIWEAIADAIPEQAALINGARQVGWGEFDARAARLAQAYRDAGLGAGSKIAIDLYNCNEWLEAFYAAIKIRAIPANVNYRYLGQEFRHLLVDSHAEALVYHRSLAERLLPVATTLPQLKLIVEVDDSESGAPSPGVANIEALIAGHAPAARIERSPEDQFLSYTGGTTGQPKGVMMSLGRSALSIAFFGPMLGFDEAAVADPIGAAVRFAREGKRLIALPASPLMHRLASRTAYRPTTT